MSENEVEADGTERSIDGELVDAGQYTDVIRSMYLAPATAARLDVEPEVAEAIRSCTHPAGNADRLPLWVVWEAGQYAMHAARLYALEMEKRDPDKVPLWAEPLQRGAYTINKSRAAGYEERVALGVRLRRVLNVGENDAHLGHVAAKWLLTPSDNQLIATTGHLAREILGNVVHNARDDKALLAAAWWSVHGQRIAHALHLTDYAGRHGNLSADDDLAARRRQRDVAFGMSDAQFVTKAAITELCGISRPTLNTWLHQR